MSRIAGIAIDHEAARVVRVVRGRIVATETLPRAPEESTEALVIRVLDRVSRRSYVRVALGSRYAQLRMLHGFPEMSRDADRVLLLRQNVRRFLPVPWRAVATSSVARPAPGRPMASACDERTLQVLGNECRARGLELDGVLPAALALLHACQWSSDDPAGVVRWRDEDEAVLLELKGGTPVGINRSREAGPSGGGLPAGTSLRGGGGLSWECAEALGAALVPRRDSLLIRPPQDERSVARRVAIRTALLAAVASAAWASALALPAWTAQRAARLTDRRNAEVAAGLRTLSRLSQVSASLQRIAAITGRRGTMTEALWELTSVLPESTAVVSLRRDSIGTAITVLTTAPTEVIAAITESPRLGQAQVVSPLTRELLAGRELQRVSLRLTRTAIGTSVTP